MLRPVTSRSSCKDSQVTGNSTISHNGGEIGVVTGTCSPSGGNKRSTLAERQNQYSLCTPGCECFPHSQLRVELQIIDNQLRMFVQVLSPVRIRLQVPQYTRPTASTSSTTCHTIRVNPVQSVLFLTTHNDFFWDGQTTLSLYLALPQAQAPTHSKSGTMALVAFSS